MDIKKIGLIIALALALLTGCVQPSQQGSTPVPPTLIQEEQSSGFDLSKIPAYVDCPYCEVNGNKPFFTDEEVIDQYYESYSGLDDLGRCQVAMACLSRDTMPLPYEKREDIGSVKPAGWQTAKYPELINGLYLYNRCHLIGWQLSAENANPLNLTTGTRYLNVDGMLPFENKVDAYIEKTDHHVMYRVTPIFVGDELVCRGILMEAQSVEDNDCVFCVYCYNVQPGIEIDYATGNSRLAGSSDTPFPPTQQAPTQEEERTYVLNTRSKKIHTPYCSEVKNISEGNIDYAKGVSLSELIKQGYSVCKKCSPQ